MHKISALDTRYRLDLERHNLFGYTTQDSIKAILGVPEQFMI